RPPWSGRSRTCGRWRRRRARPPGRRARAGYGSREACSPRRVCRTAGTVPYARSVLVDGAVRIEAPEGQQHDEDAAAHDRRVGQVEHGEVLRRDEVDHRALEDARGAEDPVGEVAEGT